MKKNVLVLMALLIAAPAMAAVTITAATDGEDPGVFRIDYLATGDDASGAYSLISGMAINITISAGTMDIVPGSYKSNGESTSASPGYGIYPGSIVFDVNKQVTSYGDTVAPGGDPGALGDLPGSACTIEAGALYDDDAIPSAQPLVAGTLCKFQVTGIPECPAVIDVTLDLEDVHRKGIVMEDGGPPSSVVLVPCSFCTAPSGPACWGYLTQCHADSTGDGNVNTADFSDFRDSWGKTYPDVAYNPCADYNRDGTVNTADFSVFRDNWGATGLPQDCSPGGTWPPS